MRIFKPLLYDITRKFRITSLQVTRQITFTTTQGSIRTIIDTMSVKNNIQKDRYEISPETFLTLGVQND